MVHDGSQWSGRRWEKAFKLGFYSGLVVAILLGVRGSSAKIGRNNTIGGPSH
jgi:hypothetical protein